MRRDQFADRKIMEYEAVVNGHSGLMPSNLITFAHFSVSPETNFANPSGVSPRMTPPAARSASLHGSLAPTDLSLLHVRFPMWSGPHLLMLSVTGYDPKRKFTASIDALQKDHLPWMLAVSDQSGIRISTFTELAAAQSTYSALMPAVRIT